MSLCPLVGFQQQQQQQQQKKQQQQQQQQQQQHVDMDTYNNNEITW